MLSDPFERREAPRQVSAGAPYWIVILLATALGALAVGAGMWIIGLRNAAPANVEVRPTNDVLVAIHNLSRLEVTEVQVEKVVDLSDKQQMFGFLETEDAMLLVAAGSATIGVDFDKLEPGDATFDEDTKTARLKLPPPELLNSRLDPDNTYVYKRETGVLAKRNENLETRARKEAIAAVERAAKTPEVDERARKQTERTLTALLTQLGAKHVEITWKKPGDRASKPAKRSGE